MNNIKWREFTQHDWYGYCDAVMFSDGRQPLITELTVDGRDAIAILDGNGLLIDIYNLDGHNEWYCFNPIESARLIARMQYNMNGIELKHVMDLFE